MSQGFTKRLVVYAEVGQCKRILDFQAEHRIPSEMAAIRELIDLGLKAAQHVEPER
jgi:hypothetical protein